MNLNRTLAGYLFQIILIAFLVTSCKSRLVRAEKFYMAWENESKPISENDFENLNQIHQTVYHLYERFTDSANNGKNRILPNIKYLVIEQSLNVSICDSIIKTKDPYDRIFFQPINNRKPTKYIISPRSRIPSITLLYYTDNYKKVIQKRKSFSSPSVYGIKKDKNVMAVFDGLVTYPLGRMRYDDLLFRIRSLTISQNLKKAILQLDHNFGSVKIYYEYESAEDFWNAQRFDELNSH